MARTDSVPRKWSNKWKGMNMWQENEISSAGVDEFHAVKEREKRQKNHWPILIMSCPDQDFTFSRHLLIKPLPHQDFTWSRLFLIETYPDRDSIDRDFSGSRLILIRQKSILILRKDLKSVAVYAVNVLRAFFVMVAVCMWREQAVCTGSTYNLTKQLNRKVAPRYTSLHGRDACGCITMRMTPKSIWLLLHDTKKS